jgi:hypothetical protein
MSFTPTMCSLAVIYKCKINIDLKFLIENTFKIDNIVFDNGKIVDTNTDQVLIDANSYFIEKPNKYAHESDGLFLKQYAVSKNIMYYSYPTQAIPRGVICNMCNIDGPNMHSPTCPSPIKSSLYINQDGITYLKKHVKNLHSELNNNNYEITNYQLDNYENSIRLIDLHIPGYEIKSNKENQFNASILSVKYHYEKNKKTKSSESVNSGHKKTHFQNMINIHTRITMANPREIKANIFEQPWEFTTFYKKISKELKKYVYDDPEINIIFAKVDTVVKYNFDKFFIEMKYGNRDIRIKRPANMSPRDNGPYIDDPILIMNDNNFREDFLENAEKVLLLFKDIYYNIIKIYRPEKNIYYIYPYKLKNTYFDNELYYYTFEYAPIKSNYTIHLKIERGNIFSYNSKNMEIINNSLNDIYKMLEQYEDNITVIDKITTDKLYTVMKGTILGKLPATMPKIVKDDGKMLSSGVKGQIVNVYDKEKKIFTPEEWILHNIDKANNNNVLLSKKDRDDGQIYSMPYSYVRLANYRHQIVCRNESDKDCRPAPYSFKHGLCPEGIIQMVNPSGEQAAYDARFYPCCENYSHNYMIRWLLNGFTKEERTEYLIPDEVRTINNMDTVIDNFTGSLDPVLMNTDLVLIKNKGPTKHTHKYIWVKYIRKDNKLENKEVPNQYIVKSGGKEISINGTDLHPIYREVRNFRGLLKEIPDENKRNIMLQEFIEQTYPEHKIFFKVGYDIVFNVEDMHTRYAILNRKNLTNLCSEQYYIDMVPKSSVYAEIRFVDGKCYIIDIYGRGYIIKIIDNSFKNPIIRGYLNYDQQSTRKTYFYTSSSELHKYEKLLHDEIGLNIRQLSKSPNKIAKYIKSVYNDLPNCDIIIYNDAISYHIQKIHIRKVALKILDIDINNDYTILMGFKDGTSLMKEYKKSDDAITEIPAEIEVGDYIRCKVNCINGDLKINSYIDIEKVDEKVYDNDVDNKRYLENLIYQIDWKMFNNTIWEFSKEINGRADTYMEDNDARYNMKCS